MANPSKRHSPKSTRTVPARPASRAEEKKAEAAKTQSVTLPPAGGPTPGAMGTGPNATAAGPHGDETHADVTTLPLRPETVTPTAPAPTQQQLRTATAGKRRSKPPRIPLKTVNLTVPAPPISELEERVQELISMQGEHPDQDLIGDIMMTALRMVRDGSTRGELKILAATLRELRYAFNIFRPFRDRRKITIFGSARTPPDAPEYIQAKKFSEAMVRNEFMVITGAGAGIMEAAQGGAGRNYSFGVNIKLPFEQTANPYIEGDKKLIHFRYFFTRKLCFVKEASAIALFPGGFGTHDECFETLTLIQTGKAAIIPIVFIDKPGGRYWREWADYVVNHLLANKLISEEDMHLIKITDDVEWAANEVKQFYKRYHSSRFVKDMLVIRMLTPLPKGTLDMLNEKYAPLLIDSKATNKKIIATGPMPEEAAEHELLDLPRIAFHFNRRNYGRLRLLIDEMNRA